MSTPHRRFHSFGALLLAVAGLVGPASGPAAPTDATSLPPTRSGASSRGSAREWKAARVRVAGGWLRGATAGTWKDVRTFKGIPYAAPPIGERRWRAPAPPEGWTGERDASAFGRACPQQPAPAPGMELGAPTDEDCLTLNVWTPARSPSERLPVLVWLHGGAYIYGASSQRQYDGAALARRGVVVVSVNYRLGPLGLLAHPALSKESGRDASGNYAILDVIEALRWTRDHAARFGGDPACVTVFGESSGAGLVNALLVSPLAEGLFHRAILQSGSLLGRIAHLREAWYFLPPAEEMGGRVARDIGAAGGDVLAVMRAKSVEEVFAAAKPQAPFSGVGNLFAPIVDGWVIPDEPATLLASGRFNVVPILAGANEDEGSVFGDVFRQTTVIGYQQFAYFGYGGQAKDVLRLFPAAGDHEAPRALTRGLGFAAFVAPARRLAEATARAGARAFRYHFSRVRPGTLGERWGAFHGSEIPFVMDNLARREVAGFGTLDMDERDRALAAQMSAAWVRFAATGDPNGAGLPHWPAYRPDDQPSMEFGKDTAARAGLYREICDVFDAAMRDWQARRLSTPASR